jgi:hypothetical protein
MSLARHLVLAAALTQFYPASPRPEVRPAVIIGQVVDHADKRGIAKAIVQITGEGVTHKAAADDLGRFFFVNLPAGTYTITASRDGFFDGAFGRVRAGGTSLPLPLEPGQWISHVPIELFRPAVISGYVDDEANEPLVGIRVQALRREFVNGRPRLVPAGTASTDDQGHYRLFDLMPGEYIVSVQSVQVTVPVATLEAVGQTGSTTPALSTLLFMNAGANPSSRDLMAGLAFGDDGRTLTIRGDGPTPPDAAAYATVYYPGADLPQGSIPIAVGPAGQRVGVNFQLRPVPVATVEGIAVGRDGPVPNQLLRLRQEGAEDFGVGSDAAATMTAADGSFTFVNVPAGRYVIEARSARSLLLASPHHQPFPDSPGASNPPPAALAERERFWGRSTLTVFDADIEHLLVDLKPGLTMSGSVVFAGETPVPDASARESMRLVLETESGLHPGVPPAPVGQAGGFTIPGLLPDRYRIALAGAPPGWFLASAMVAGRDISHDWLDMTNGLDVDRIVIRLIDRPSIVNGGIMDASGRYLGGARVVAMPAERAGAFEPRRVRSVRADVYGIYVLAGLPAGEYDIVAVDDAEALNWQDLDVLTRLSRSATRVRVREGETSQVNLRVVR